MALKRVKLDEENEGVASSALREILILKALDHENVVQLMDVSSSDRRMTMIFEFCDMERVFEVAICGELKSAAKKR